MQYPNVFRAIKERIHSCQCAVILDIDETLLNPLYKFKERINASMKLELSVQQIEYSGGLEHFFRGNPRYNEFKEMAEYLRANEEFNSDLPIVEGALEGVQKLLDIPSLSIGGYLTTRPFAVTGVTEIDLQAKGFPFAPLVTRPSEVPREATTQWKLSVLNDLAKDYMGVLIMIDDAIPIAKAIREINKESDDFIVAILFNGPITYSAVEREGVGTCSSEHFYVAEWKDIPGICAHYASKKYSTS